MSCNRAVSRILGCGTFMGADMAFSLREMMMLGNAVMLGVRNVVRSR